MLKIRRLMRDDAQKITDEEIKQGWHATVDKYLTRLKDMADGKAIALCAELDGEPVGYVNVYFAPNNGPFVGKGWPEIVDFGVLEKCRRQGIGSRLMDEAEKLAGERSEIVTIGVGLHAGYGSAQRMYVKRGYIPDGSGVWYGNKVCEPYTPCENDDDLVLYFSKKL